MSGIVLADTTPAPPGGTVHLPVGVSMLWHGWDGSEWDIGNPRSPVRLASGVRGLTQPDVAFNDVDLVGVDGSLEQGWRVGARSVFWPLRVFHLDGGQQWLDLDSALWRTLQPGRHGVWEVVQPSGTSRTLTCRCDGDGGHAYDTDPAINGWTRYGVNLTATDPFWRGTPLKRRWSSAQGEPFYGGNDGGGFAPPYVISPASTIATATMRNLGDVPAWPVWTVFGPTTSVTLGLDGRLVQVPFAVADGSALVIDTDPRAQTAFDATVAVVDGERVAVLTDTERTGELGAADYAPIPPGMSVPLSLQMTGNGAIQAAITPGYFRAW